MHFVEAILGKQEVPMDRIEGHIDIVGAQPAWRPRKGTGITHILRVIHPIFREMSRRLDKQPVGLSTTAKKPLVDRGFAGFGAATSTTEQTTRVLRPNHNSSSTTSSYPAPTPTSISQHPSTLGSSIPMDQIRAKLSALRAEADAAVDRAEAAEAKNKKYEQELLVKDQEIGSLQHKLGLVEGDLEKTESKLTDLKHAADEGVAGKSTNEALTRKIQLLEEELDTSEKNVKETVEKLRQVDVKAEHFERQVQRLEQERDVWEKKYEDMQLKYQESKKELDELVRSMGDI
ncbi:hypothetical protein FRB99_004918 [Tulasnella sp. 403]|nr:hypothetical protein FRB99_004918 [Tulasnella sp. 403]